MSVEIEQQAPVQGDIVAKAANYYRMTRLLMVLIFVGCGAWFGYDGFVTYPKENTQIDQLQAELDKADAGGDVKTKDEILEKLRKHKSRHGDTDILIQKLLGFALPPVGIALLSWSLYNSRGEFRLTGNTLNAPGHPPVTLDRIRQIDKALWDRKGIAYLSYYQPGQVKPAKIKLDDFVYERPGIDAIFTRVEEAIAAPAPQPKPAVRATPVVPAKSATVVPPPRAGVVKPVTPVRPPPANRPPPPKTL